MSDTIETMLRDLDASRLTLAKRAAAFIRQQSAHIDEAATHVAHADSVVAENARIIAASGMLADSPNNPPITPNVAFDIMSERANCAAIALGSLDNAFTVDDITGKSLSEQFRMVQGRISSAILAQAKPVLPAKA